MSSLVSVIVPVYNSTAYLKRCVDAILAQTYKDLEVVLVDDGSTDDSLDICREYAKNDSRVKVFHKENGGSSSARNVGIKEATGEYICFCDSDDYYEPDIVENLMKVFNENQRNTFGVKAGPLHDPATIASIIDDKLITYQHMNVVIDISHGPSYGRTNCDVFDYLHAPKNAYVAMDIDVDRYWDLIEEGIRQYK